MVLRALGSCASKLTLQHAQLPDLSNVELFPAMRCTALTLTADLKTEQTLDATPDAVVVRRHLPTIARTSSSFTTFVPGVFRSNFQFA